MIDARSIAHGIAVAATLGALAAPLPAFAADAGRIQFVYGDVRITAPDGGERRARRGEAVEEGATVRTSARSAAQLKMVDGAALAVRPRTEVRIDSYSFENDEKKDRSFLSLLRGTLRSITGLIGRNNRSNYRVSTSTATIGIRGSDADIGFDPATGLAAVRTNVGGHSLSTNVPGGTGDTLQSNPGQIIVALPGQAPTFAPTFPFATPTPPAGAGRGGNAQGGGEGQSEGGESEGGQRQAGGGEDADGEGNNQRQPGPGIRQGRRGAFAGVPLVRPPPSSTIGGTQGQQLAQTEQTNLTKFVDAPAGSVAVGSFFRGTGGQANSLGVGNTAANASNTQIRVDTNNRVVGLRDVDQGTTFEFDGRTATLGAAGSVAIRNAQQVQVAQAAFGYWSSGFTIKENGVVQPIVGPFHFAVATNLTSLSQIQNLNGIPFSYSRKGGLATNETGAQASSFSSTIAGVFQNNANLGTVSVSINASFPAGSTNWTLGTSGSVAGFMSDQGLNLSGTCCGGGPVGATGSITGRFLGTAAEGVISSFAADRAGLQRINGTILGER